MDFRAQKTQHPLFQILVLFSIGSSHEGSEQVAVLFSQHLSVWLKRKLPRDDAYLLCFMSSGKSTPVSTSGTADPSKPCDPFQPFGGDAIDPFQSKKGLGDPFSGKDPFAPSSASSKDPKDRASGFADLSSVS